MENDKCIKCKEAINPLRLKALPGTSTCVECSTIGAKRGVPVMFGSKDHTWTDLVVMEENEYEVFKEREKNKDQGFDKLED
tara:strand:+ start:137 stop:379 length:243 start_codon:yes stop_codon:yes gene_type:complete